MAQVSHIKEAFRFFDNERISEMSKNIKKASMEQLVWTLHIECQIQNASDEVELMCLIRLINATNLAIYVQFLVIAECLIVVYSGSFVQTLYKQCSFKCYKAGDFTHLQQPSSRCFKT